MPDQEIEKNLEQYVNQTENNQIGVPLTDAPKPQSPIQKVKDEISTGNMIGWQSIPIKELPTQGLFYPDGTEIFIKAALSEEIRHWSTLNEDDLSALDDMLNYVIERCAIFKTPNKFSSWKDIKEVDRFYIILAIRELTFIKGDNKLQVKVSETKKIDVNKSMIDYINFNEDIMQFYNPEQKCFEIIFSNNRSIKVDIPSIGITSWLKGYLQRMQQVQQPIDKDYVSYAPFILREWRGLNDDVYKDAVYQSLNWTAEEISALSEIKELFKETINVVIKYNDEGGMEHTAPLNFLGGIKSLFLISGALKKLGKNRNGMQ